LSKQLYEIPVTKEQFEQSVERWIGRLYNKPSGGLICGFCEAQAIESAIKEDYISCSCCGLYPKICGHVNSVYEHWVYGNHYNDDHKKQQACLELLEGLYDYGVKHGFIDPCGDCALGQECVCVNTSVE